MRRTTAAIVLATGLLVTACSSDDGTASDDAESSSTASETTGESESAAPTESAEAGSGGDVAPADVPGLALTATDFPAPYEFMELPPGALEGGSEAIGGVLAGATYSPAECGAAAEALQGTDLSQSGLAVAADQASGAAVVAVVTPATEQSQDVEELADTCASFTFSLTGPDGSKLNGDATLELLPEPSVEADQARAATTTVTVSSGGQKQTIDTTVYTAQLRGVQVAVSSTASPDAPVDPDVLQQLLVASVAKVQAY